jgi:hypothetical protein
MVQFVSPIFDLLSGRSPAAITCIAANTFAKRPGIRYGDRTFNADIDSFLFRLPEVNLTILLAQSCSAELI